MGKAGRPRLDKQDMAKMLVEAAMLGDRSAASKYNVSLSTLQRYRKELQNDTDFGSLFVKTASPILTRAWSDDLDDALRKTIAKLMTMVAAQDSADPKALEAVTGVFNAFAEMQLTKEYLNDDTNGEQARAFEEAQAGLSSSFN